MLRFLVHLVFAMKNWHLLPSKFHAQLEIASQTLDRSLAPKASLISRLHKSTLLDYGEKKTSQKCAQSKNLKLVYLRKLDSRLPVCIHFKLLGIMPANEIFTSCQ